MIMGIGVDMVSEARCAKHQAAGLSGKLYTPAELAVAGGQGHAPADGGGQFCRKGSLRQGTGCRALREFALCEAEALRDENGAPYFSFSGRAAALMQARGLTAHLSLTHEGGTAAAFVVLERREASASLKEEPECSTLR